MPGRLNLNMTITDCIAALSEGIPGALTLLISYRNGLHKIDKVHPDYPFMLILMLGWFDEWDLVGEKLWLLYKDICGANLYKFMLVTRAVQLAVLDKSKMMEDVKKCRLEKEAIEPYDFDAIEKGVVDKLGDKWVPDLSLSVNS